MKKKGLLATILLTLSVFLIACTNNQPLNKDGNQPTINQEQPQGKQSDIGQTKDVDGVKVKLIQVVESEGKGIYTAQPGQIFLQPQFEMTNNSPEKSKALVFFYFYIDGSDEFGIQAPFTTTEGAEVVSLDYGQTINGYSGTLVPDNWQKLEINYRTHALGEDVVFIVQRSDLP